ncbi:MAG: hypothetical protein Q9157_008622 [Trypethelium eluteriae]
MPFPFLKLPTELRLEIYKNLLPEKRVYIHHNDLLPSGKVALSSNGITVASTCQQIQKEILPLLIKNELLVFLFHSRPTVLRWGRMLDCNTRLFTCMQEIYDAAALPEADRKAFVECEYGTVFKADALSFAKLAPAVQKLWFIIQGEDPEDYYEAGMELDDEELDEEKWELELRLYLRLESNNGNWLFEMAKKPHTVDWNFQRVGRGDGWQVVGRYVEDDDERMMRAQHIRDRFKYRLIAG